jgi:hypothetical protein
MEPKVYYPLHNNPPLVPIMSQLRLVHTFSHHLPKIRSIYPPIYV